MEMSSFNCFASLDHMSLSFRYHIFSQRPHLSVISVMRKPKCRLTAMEVTAVGSRALRARRAAKIHIGKLPELDTASFQNKKQGAVVSKPGTKSCLVSDFILKIQTGLLRCKYGELDGEFQAGQRWAVAAEDRCSQPIFITNKSD